MVEVDIFSCDVLNCHGSWSPFELFSFACKVAQEGQSWNFPCYMLTPLNLKLGLANFFPYGKGFKTLKAFLPPTKTVALVQSVLNSKTGPHFCCCQNWSNQF